MTRQPPIDSKYVSRRALGRRDAAIYVVRDVSDAGVVLSSPENRHGTLFSWPVFRAELRSIDHSVLGQVRA